MRLGLFGRRRVACVLIVLGSASGRQLVVVFTAVKSKRVCAAAREQQKYAQ